MQILEITTILKSGSGLVTTRIAQGLKKRGHEVDVISTGKIDGLSDWDELIDELQKSGIGHFQMNFFKREHERFWPETQKLAKLLSEKKYDIIHVHAGVPAFATHVARRTANVNIPVVATFHSWSPIRPEWMNIADAWAFNECDMVCYVSHAYRKYGQSKGIHAPTSVIYPGLWFNPQPYINKKHVIREKIRKKYGLPKDAKIITQLAEVYERKGQLDLIRAMQQIFDYDNNTYLLLAGNTTDYPDYVQLLQEEIRKLSLENKVIFTGWVEDPYEIVAAADLFVFPSYNEGLGLAILEAMVLEIPAIFSEIEGTLDIKNIVGNDGLGGFAPGDVQAIAERIKQVMKMDKEVLEIKVKNAANKISKIFNFDYTVVEYEKLFNRLVADFR
ncbi:glycosyl transferases group 1 family protein [Geobacillus kaustophilus]|uniref:Glycosyl transferases group 1 family protein n=1 Tax=Geobacillus kaustophilus TaxID=1462 RepID=A0A0D8BSI9_GEOKU|nr:glycosyltransferase family 4 protein [Geobacillus kaustophilus]KJE26954.1 glycosyl transferases group 1 family protein [Geobacillus kaustophilus]